MLSTRKTMIPGRLVAGFAVAVLCAFAWHPVCAENAWVQSAWTQQVALVTPSGRVLATATVAPQSAAAIASGTYDDLWIALNGSSFAHFSHAGQLLGTFALPDQAAAAAIATDSTGNVWVVGQESAEVDPDDFLDPDGGGIVGSIGKNLAVCYDRRGKLLHVFPFHDAVPTAVIRGPQGSVWLGTEDGVYSATASGSLHKFVAVSDAGWGVLLATDPDGNLWVASSSGNQSSFTEYTASGKQLAQYAAATSGRLASLAATRDSLVYVEQRGGAWELSPGVPSAKPVHVNGVAGAVAADSTGRFWIASKYLDQAGRYAGAMTLVDARGNAVAKFALPRLIYDPATIAMQVNPAMSSATVTPQASPATTPMNPARAGTSSVVEFNSLENMGLSPAPSSSSASSSAPASSHPRMP